MSFEAGLIQVKVGAKSRRIAHHVIGNIGSEVLGAAVLSLVFGIGVFLGEGLFLAFTRAVDWWWFWIPLGIGGPLVLLLSIAVGINWSWRRKMRVEVRDGGHETESPRRQILDWLWFAPVEKAVRSSARLLAFTVLLIVWFALGLWAGQRIFLDIVTPVYVVLLEIIVLFIGGLLLYASEPFLVFPFSVMLGRISRLPLVGAFCRPLVFCLLGVIAALSVLIYGWVRFGETLDYMPWALVVGPIIGAVLCLLIVPKITRGRILLERSALGLSVSLLLIGGLTIFLPQSSTGALDDNASLTGIWLGILKDWLDFDHDGTIGLYGGGDCAQFNPNVGPYQIEIPKNGIDDDCMDGDLKAGYQAFDRGPRSHPKPKGITTKPNIVFVTTDALSMHHTSLGGYPRDVTPNLSAWARDAQIFTSAFATGAATRSAFPGLLAGMFPSMLRMTGTKQPHRWDKSVQTIATYMKESGYRTVHIVSNRYLANWSGYSGGFDTVEHPWRQAEDKEHTAPEVSRAIISHIKAVDSKPLFLWAHYTDHHGPYSIPKGAPSFGKRSVDKYDAELKFADKHWKYVFRAVAARWKPSEYLLLFTADHGEAFDENHPKTKHTGVHYTEVLHVPLIIQAPWSRGTKINGLVSHFDILPTIGSIVGFGPKEDWLGESLIPTLVQAKPPNKQAVSALSYYPERARNGREGFARFSMRTNEFHYYTSLSARRGRLVRWREDNLDRKDLFDSLPQIAELFRYNVAERFKYLKKNERASDRD